MNTTLIHPSLGANLQPTFLDRTCTVQRATESTSSRGQVTGAFSNLTGAVDLPCRVWPVSSSELRRSQGIIELGTHTALVDGLPSSVVPKDRLTSDGVTYDILGVEPDSATAFTRLRLEVRTP